MLLRRQPRHDRTVIGAAPAAGRDGRVVVPDGRVDERRELRARGSVRRAEDERCDERAARRVQLRVKAPQRAAHGARAQRARRGAIGRSPAPSRVHDFSMAS